MNPMYREVIELVKQGRNNDARSLLIQHGFSKTEATSQVRLVIVTMNAPKKKENK